MLVGLITFHGSHNHGSMLQAYATQQTVIHLGCSCEIINFRMRSQKDYYALLQTKYGAMRFFRGLLLLPLYVARNKREQKFEEFLHDYLVLSGSELETYTELENVSDKYDIYISGSDQIWSNQIPELIRSKVDYTGVYFFDFVDKEKKRIAYAPSVGVISYEDLAKKKALLAEYDSISTREERGAQMLAKLTGLDVPTVLDPTFLLTGDEWRKIAAEPILKEKYIFLYTLRGIRPGLKWAKYLKKLGDKLNMKVVSVSPFFPVASLSVTNLINVGPRDFLCLIDHAELVFTDSFHGTAFSLIMNRPFYTLNRSEIQDPRKTDLLNKVGLENRVLHDFDEIELINHYDLDYTTPNQKLDVLRTQSIEYLSGALGFSGGSEYRKGAE